MLLKAGQVVVLVVKKVPPPRFSTFGGPETRRRHNEILSILANFPSQLLQILPILSQISLNFLEILRFITANSFKTSSCVLCNTAKMFYPQPRSTPPLATAVRTQVSPVVVLIHICPIESMKALFSNTKSFACLLSTLNVNEWVSAEPTC